MSNKATTMTVQVDEPYPIHVGEGLLTSELLLKTCHKISKRFVIISDANVSSIYGNELKSFLEKTGLEVTIVTFPAGEKYKSRETKQKIEDKMLSLNYGRDSAIIALGGGVVCDLAGFVGATYVRGIPTLYIPTTTLAMIDASVGGKTGVNTESGKNLIGAIYHPNAVFSDLKLLESLNQHEYLDGMVEAIKHALLKGGSYYSLMKDNWSAIMGRDAETLKKIIIGSCEIKKNIVQQDENENGTRQLLNLGHTVAHAIEKTSGYEISHGLAVALGLVSEGKMAEHMGLLPNSSSKKVEALLLPYLKSLAPKTKLINIDALCKAMVLDKKSEDKTARFVLLEDIGKPHTPSLKPAVTVPHESQIYGLNYIISELDFSC